MLAFLAAIVLGVAPAPARPPVTSACASAPAAATTLPATLPAEIWNNHVYVKVCAAGRELEFILDTGAGATAIDLDIARQLAVPLGHTLTVGGAGAGRVAGARVDGFSVTIAGSSITQSVASAIDFSRLPPREGHRIDGILGYDFITRYVLAIDYTGSELRLYDHNGFRYDGPGRTVPVTLIDRFPHIDADVKLADGEMLSGRFVIDVGSGAGLSLTKPFVDDHRLRERVGPTVRRHSSGGIGGRTTSDVGRIASLSIGGIELIQPTVHLYGDSAGVLSRRVAWVGNIGGEILRRFTLFLDYGEGKLIFEPNGTLRDPFEASMSGASIAMDDSLTAMVVDVVEPETPASDAGLERGDVILSVDGVSASQSLLGELRERFRRPGERLRLTVRRGGENRQIEIVTRRLV